MESPAGLVFPDPQMCGVDLGTDCCKHLWESAPLLVAALSMRSWHGARVLELGCGASGYVGMHLAALGANVLVTDKDKRVGACVRECIKANAKRIAEAGGTIEYSAVDWSTSEPVHGRIVVAADVLYKEDLAGIFLAYFAQIAPKEAFIAHKSRCPEVDSLVKTGFANFDCEALPFGKLPMPVALPEASMSTRLAVGSLRKDLGKVSVWWLSHRPAVLEDAEGDAL